MCLTRGQFGAITRARGGVLRFLLNVERVLWSSDDGFARAVFVLQGQVGDGRVLVDEDVTHRFEFVLSGALVVGPHLGDARGVVDRTLSASSDFQ